MYSITEMANELKSFYASDDPAVIIYNDEYCKFIIRAIKKFYVDINHPNEYDQTLIVRDENDGMFYDHDFMLDEEEYIWILSKLGYKRKTLTGLTGDAAVSYNTNALSVTGAKEGYKSIQQEIDDLEKERRIVFNKMTRYTLPSA